VWLGHFPRDAGEGEELSQALAGHLVQGMAPESGLHVLVEQALLDFHRDSRAFCAQNPVAGET
jgi:hypothetical protein